MNLTSMPSIEANALRSNSIEQYKQLDLETLSNIEGGVIPFAFWAICAAGFGAGLGAGTLIGLNRKSRK